MFYLTKRSVAVAILTTVVLLSGSSRASANTERFGVFAIQNDTADVTIYYQVKLGNGSWTTYSIAPGQQRTHWHKYSRQNGDVSPVTLIRFNSAVGSNPAFMFEYRLTRYEAPDRLYQYAKKYSFQKNDNNYFDLTSIN